MSRFGKVAAPAATSPSGPEPNYFAGRREWEGRWTDMAVGKRNWQLTALILLALDAALVAALVWMATTSKITPYVVEVDRFGQALAFGPAEKLGKYDERLYRYQLSLVIYNLRSVFSDRGAQLGALQQAYAYLGAAATTYVNDYFHLHPPIADDTVGTTAVQVTSVLRLSDNSWQVQWSEQHRTLQGRENGDEKWQAVVSTELHPPEKADTILKNPLGLYITSINWTRVTN